jgi:hypothetical protein
MNWRAAIGRDRPHWQDYLSLLDRLDAASFPRCGDLQRLLPAGLRTASGHPVRFEAQERLPPAPYELRIHETGVVSTRAHSWHDLFNALAWARLPSIKRAINALHCRPGPPLAGDVRGPLRDALTLFDECGVVVACADVSLLTALARRDWSRAFEHHRAAWAADVTVVVVGHAMLEKFLAPYKAMTANALLVGVSAAFRDLPREARLRRLDVGIAGRMLADSMLTRTRDLSPLPLAGIPGWWTDEAQGPAFYRDADVFRPPPAGLTPSPVHVLA